MFYFPADIGNNYYGQGHPMKPHRIRMTHNLLLNYGLYRKMEIYVSSPILTTEVYDCFSVRRIAPAPLKDEWHSRSVILG